MNKKQPVEKRFWKYVMPEPNSGCWFWSGVIDKDGYGVFYKSGRFNKMKFSRAHRVSYEINVGQIPEGLELDHLCRVRCCVNPDHLEAVTKKVNIARGQGASAKNSKKTHCPSGHEYSVENTTFGSKGRHCRTCNRNRARKRNSLKAA